MTTTQQLTQQAIDKVRDNNLETYNRILDFAKEWFKTQYKSVSSENLKSCYYLCGNTEVVEPRVFGAVFRKLSRDGHIFKNGFEISKNPICHNRPQQLWISKEYRMQQQKNRKHAYPEFEFENAS